MGKKPSRLDPKAKVLLSAQAISGTASQIELASKYNIHPSVVSRLKSEAQDILTDHFTNGKTSEVKGLRRQVIDLQQLLGKTHAEMEVLKKKLGS